MNRTRLFGIIVAATAPVLSMSSCDSEDTPVNGNETGAPEGMVEIRPVLPGIYSSIPRQQAEAAASDVPSRKYDDNTVTDALLVNTVRLPEQSTVWLIAKNVADGSLERRAYVVYNAVDDENTSYLIPCTVNEKGEVVSSASAPLYLKENQSYTFFAISPARELDEEKLKEGQVAFNIHNGEQFYAHDCRYGSTTPQTVSVSGGNNAVQQVTLSPMVNQTTVLRFLIEKGLGVHDLDILPTGIMVAGLQNDAPAGVPWHMSQAADDEPIDLLHGSKTSVYYQYNYSIDDRDRVQIEVPVIPMWTVSKPVVVLFRLKINGVPTVYEVMLNEKDFKAGYSYAYRGTVSISAGIDLVSWQFVSWDVPIDFPK